MTIKKDIVDQSDFIPRQDSPDSKPQHRKTVLCYCSLWILVVVIALALIWSLLSTVWWRGLINARKSDDVIVYNRSAVIIKEVNQYYDGQLKLKSVPGVPLQDSVIRIYQFNSSCNHLPTDNNIIWWHKSNVSGNQNYTHLYLLPGSTQNYTISTVEPIASFVSQLVADSIFTHLDAKLEKVKGYIYITHGSERQEFDSTNCPSTSADCNIVYHKPFMYNQHDTSHYNFHSAHVVPDCWYSLNLAVNATTVDLIRGQYKCNISNFNEGERSCNVGIDFKFKFYAL